MTPHTPAWLIACALIFAHGPTLAQHMNKAEFESRSARIDAQHQADRDACKRQQGNNADVCRLEAKAKKEVALAELRHARSGEASDHVRLLETKANTAYDIDRERCDDDAGQKKEVCIQAAKSARAKARADAQMSEDMQASRDKAASQKAKADLQLAKEKCESLAGPTKDECLLEAKRRHDKD